MGRRVDPTSQAPELQPGRAPAIPIRILLVEDHTLVRAGLRALIDNMPGIEVVGEAANGHEALRRVRDLLPDVVLMDLRMPELDGLETMPRIRAEYPSIRVLLLTVHDDEESVCQALAAGASGYLLKASSPVELELAVRSVAAGGTYLTPSVTRHVISDGPGRVQPEGSRRPRLSPRQRNVAQLVAGGHSNREIARDLGLSVKTIETHRRELMARLGVHEVAGVVRYAVRTGLVNEG